MNTANASQTINEQILSSILKILKERNMTEKECLVQTNINTNFFSSWKSNKTKSPSFDKVYRIATFLNVSIDYLISGKNDTTIIDAKEIVNDKLTGDERSLINTYKDLDEDGKMKMLDFAKELWADHRQPKGKLSSSQNNKSVG